MTTEATQKALLNQINHSEDRLWSFDRDMVCTVVNDVLSRDIEMAFGVRLEVGMDILSYLSGYHLEKWKGKYEAVLRGEPQFFQEISDVPNLSAKYVEFTIVPVVEDGEVIGGVGRGRDITTIMELQLGWHKSQAQLVAQIENTTDSIWSVDTDFRILTMNSVFRSDFKQAYGVNLNLNDRIVDSLPEELKTKWINRYNKAFSGEHFQEVDLYEYGDASIYIEVSFNPIEVDGEVIGVACFTKDITAIKNSELKAKKASDTKDKLFSIIGHDLKGPIGNIREMSKLMELIGDGYDQQSRQQMVRHIRESSEKVFTLLDNLLSWSLTQQDKIKIEKSNLVVSNVISESIDPYALSASTKSIETKIELPDGMSVCADARFINTIVGNLYNNAIKFTKDSGVIIIKVEKRTEAVVFSVQDNGKGMSKELLNKVLEDGSAETLAGTNNEKGTGLGLALCKEFVRLHDGRFWAESEEAQGTTFFFSIPD